MLAQRIKQQMAARRKIIAILIKQFYSDE